LVEQEELESALDEYKNETLVLDEQVDPKDTDKVDPELLDAKVEMT